MKKINLILLFVVTLLLLSFNGCTTIQVPEQVCTYGSMVCETGNYVCNNFEIPEPICMYFNLACSSLQTLCNTEPGSVAYNDAIKNLELANTKLNTFLQDNIANSPGENSPGK